MADDAAALLAALGIDKAHVVGVSMGGMITQALVINHADLFLSASSIMSTTGDRAVGAPTGEAMTALLRPVATSREEAIQASVEGSLVIGSPGYPTDERILRERAAAAYDRSYCPEGTARQLGAILGSPDRTEGLHGVGIPFLVVHGEADPLVTLSGGEATAAAVPGPGCSPSRAWAMTSPRRCGAPSPMPSWPTRSWPPSEQADLGVGGRPPPTDGARAADPSQSIPSHRRRLPPAVGPRAAQYRSLTMTSHSSPMTDVPDSERTGTGAPDGAAASPMVEAQRARQALR